MLQVLEPAFLSAPKAYLHIRCLLQQRGVYCSRQISGPAPETSHNPSISGCIRVGDRKGKS